FAETQIPPACGDGFCGNELILEFPTKSMPSGFRTAAILRRSEPPCAPPRCLSDRQRGQNSWQPHLVTAGLTAIPIIGHLSILIAVAGTSPAMTPRALLPLPHRHEAPHGSRRPQFHYQLRAPAPFGSRRASPRA